MSTSPRAPSRPGRRRLNLPKKALGFRVQEYGITKHRDLFTPRQLVALTTFSDLVLEARAKALEDAKAAGMDPDPTPLADSGASEELRMRRQSHFILRLPRQDGRH